MKHFDFIGMGFEILIFKIHKLLVCNLQSNFHFAFFHCFDRLGHEILLFFFFTQYTL